MEGTQMTDDTMPLAEAVQRARSMFEAEANRILEWAESAVAEVAEDHCLDRTSAASIVDAIATRRIAEAGERTTALVHQLRSIARPAPRPH